MRRRPTEVYATERPYSTGELPVIRRAPRVTPGVNPEQAIGTRSAGGSLGGPFTLPPFGASATLTATAPALAGSPAAPVDCCG